MSQQLKNRCQRYVDARDFIEFGQSLNVPISNRLLEEMEKEKLLFPTYRTMCPREYVEASWNGKEVDTDLWKEIERFDLEMGRLRNQTGLTNDKFLSEGHPLDVAWESKKDFIQKPENESFHPWKDYEVTIEDLGGAKTTRKRTWAYYEPWKIYQLDEITTHILGRYEKALMQGHLNPPSLEMPKLKSSVMQHQDMHRILAGYQFRCQLYFEKASFKAEKQGSHFIEEENRREYKNNIHIESIEAFKQASEDRWIRFARDLCKLYFRYQKRERESLKSVVRGDLLDACRVVLDALGLDYMVLAEKVGGYIDGQTFTDKFALEHIFPDHKMELIREGGNRLSSFMDDYGKATEKPGEDFGQGIFRELTDYLIDKGNEALLVKLIEINEEWFSPSLHHEESLWACLRTLSVAVEVLGKDLGFGGNIAAILNKIMDNKFEALVITKLNKRWQDINSKSSIDETSSPQGLIKRIDFIRANAPIGMGQYLITTKLLRNYLSHNTAIDLDLLGERFIFLCRSLVLTGLYLFDNQKRGVEVNS